MAFTRSMKCVKCGHEKLIVINGDTRHWCEECKKDEAKEKRDAHFTALNAKHLEERIRLIEEWIYDYKPTYVHPPRLR